MTTTEIIYAIGDLFQWSFGFFEFVGNYFNTMLIILGFFGFGYWMNLQRKMSAQSNVPVDVKDNEGWYKKENQKLK
jgi:hypothetical protein